MNRRKSLKLIATGAVGIPAVIAGCKTEDKKTGTEIPVGETPKDFPIDRYKDELANEKRVQAQGKFFTPEEMATITVLGDIIIPKDDISGSASDAKVPDFIDFMANDDAKIQVPLRGGLRWLDMQCLNKFGKPFAVWYSPLYRKALSALLTKRISVLGKAEINFSKTGVIFLV